MAKEVIPNAKNILNTRIAAWNTAVSDQKPFIQVATRNRMATIAGQITSPATSKVTPVDNCSPGSDLIRNSGTYIWSSPSSLAAQTFLVIRLRDACEQFDLGCFGGVVRFHAASETGALD